SLAGEETGKINTKYTDNTGIVMFRNVNEGSYEIEVESKGYEKESRSKYIEPHSGGEAFTLSPTIEVFEDATEKEETATEKIVVETEEEEGPESEAQESVEETVEAKGSKPIAEEIKEEEDKDESKVIGESMLVEYAPSEKSDAAVEQIVDFYLSEKRRVLLTSSQSSLKRNISRFKAKMESGEIGLISILTEESTPPSEKGIKEIPIKKPEYFTEEFEKLSPGNVVVFEPLSDLINNMGTDAAYKFISQTIDRLSSDGISFIAFLNQEGHNKKDLNSFENLFINLAKIEDGKLKKIGGL
ncbi:MAG: carboxypeptidase-like regulatory domain-containing protein, partial [Candidatus Hydrothermarchaeales archaeon]